MSMTIASMMTYGIFKFGGGAAFASFAGALGASYAGNAASQGAAVGAPGGEAAQYKKAMNDLSDVPAQTIAGVNNRQLIQALSTTKMSEVGEATGYGTRIGSEASERGMSAFEFGGEKGGFRAMNDGASVSQYGRFQSEGITSSQIGSADSYSKIRGINKVETLEANGIDPARGGQADGYNDIGNVKAAEALQKLERANGLEKGEIAAMAAVNRSARSATQPVSISENGVESLTTDFQGNKLATEGFYKELYVDTDGDGRYLKLDNATLNTKDGTVHGYHDGKEVTMKGDFIDSDASDGMISMKPAMTTINSGLKSWDGRQIEHVNTVSTKEGETGVFDGEHNLNINGQTRTMSGKLEQSGNSFYGRNLIDKETGMSYSIEATGSRGADGAFSLTPTLVEGKGTMDTLTTSDGTVLKSASVKAYGENFDDMRMVIEGTTMENGKLMSVSAEAQGRIENGQIIGDFSILNKDASEMTTVREGEDRQRLNVDKDVQEGGYEKKNMFNASLDRNYIQKTMEGIYNKAHEQSYNRETGTVDRQQYKESVLAQLNAYGTSWASGAGQIRGADGSIISDYTMNADGSVGFKIAGNGVTAGMGISRTNRDTYQHDLNFGAFMQMAEKTSELATDKDGNFNPNAHAELFADRLGNASKEIHDWGAGAQDSDFGIRGLSSEVFEPNLKDAKDLNSTVADIMAGKGASLLNSEPEEKAAMLKGIRTRMGTAPDGSSGLDSIIEKYENQAEKAKEPTTVPEIPNPFK